MLKKINKLGEIIGEYGIYLYSISLFCSKAGVNLALGLVFLSMILTYKIRKKNYYLLKEEKVFILFLILIPLFSLFSIGGIESFNIALQKNYRYLVALLLPFVITKKNIIDRSFKLVGVSIIINFINGIYYYYKRNFNFSVRYRSFGENPLNEAHMFAIIGIFILSILLKCLKEKKYKESIYYGIVLCIDLLGLLLGQGRGAWLGFGSGIIIMTFILFRKKIKQLIILLTIVGVVGTLTYKANSEIFGKNRYISRIKSIKNIESDSPKIRLIMWESGVQIFKDTFPFGTGRDNSAEYILKYLEENNKYNEVGDGEALKGVAQAGNMHSIYFSSLSEEGILCFGLIGMFIYFFISQIKFFIEQENSKNNYKYILVGIIGCLVVFCVGGLTENLWRGIWKSNVFMLILGYYFFIKKYEKFRGEIESDKN